MVKLFIFLNRLNVLTALAAINLNHILLYNQ